MERLEEATFMGEEGYLVVEVDGEIYPAHKVVYAMYHGIDLPADADIIHIDGNLLNNHVNNLRLIRNIVNGGSTQ